MLNDVYLELIPVLCCIDRHRKLRAARNGTKIGLNPQTDRAGRSLSLLGINPIRRPRLDQITHDIIRNSQIEKMIAARELIVQLNNLIVPATPHLRRGKRAKNQQHRY